MDPKKVIPLAIAGFIVFVLFLILSNTNCTLEQNDYL